MTSISNVIIINYNYDINCKTNFNCSVKVTVQYCLLKFDQVFFSKKTNIFQSIVFMALAKIHAKQNHKMICSCIFSNVNISLKALAKVQYLKQRALCV